MSRSTQRSLHEEGCYPFRLQPVYRDYLWGGERILRVFGRDEPPGRYAESWEAVDRPEVSSRIMTGPWSGHTLGDAVAGAGASLLGTATGKGPFPLLVKLIDAREPLSVQVHPGNEAAARHGGEAKSEMWYVMAADPGAFVYAGLLPGTNRAALVQAFQQGRASDVLHKVPVRKGDAVWIPGGRVHAIGKGCLLLEVQQNSDTTYRLHDWGRLDAHGQPRALHLEAAMRVINWRDRDEPKVQQDAEKRNGANRARRIAQTAFFTLDRMELREPGLLEEHPCGFRLLFVEEGSARIEWPGGAHAMPHGSTWLVPAAVGGPVMLLPDKHAALLQITPP